jgi:hypothetical protein
MHRLSAVMAGVMVAVGAVAGIAEAAGIEFSGTGDPAFSPTVYASSQRMAIKPSQTAIYIYNDDTLSFTLQNSAGGDVYRLTATGQTIGGRAVANNTTDQELRGTFVFRTTNGAVKVDDVTTGQQLCSGGTVVAGGKAALAYAQVELPVACGALHQVHYMWLGESGGGLSPLYWTAVIGKARVWCGPRQYSTTC